MEVNFFGYFKEFRHPSGSQSITPQYVHLRSFQVSSDLVNIDEKLTLAFAVQLVDSDSYGSGLGLRTCNQNKPTTLNPKSTSEEHEYF